MYSIVLATALFAGGASEGFCWRSCHGCSSCSCSCSYSSCNSCYSGCSCYGGCYSCYGGGSCHGCAGYSCSGCWGCYGGYQSLACYSCAGYSCWGGSPAGCYVPYGCGGGWAAYQNVGCFQCHGCYGYNAAWTCGMTASIPTAPGTAPNAAPSAAPNAVVKTETTGNRALVSIEVPADAKVYIDGNLMKSTGEKRVFQTPELASGKAYFYDVKAEVIRDGKAVVQDQRVVIRAGSDANASFANLGVVDSSIATRPQPAIINAGGEQ